ncbi:double-strand break repair helicase AddA [Cognatishimia activa]|uniref:double-strand break repair helicase AddA n=1 Tax=Cognatishimia activa TaxID=1715691 RepID=UPI002231DC93|nr:double-strand break repair helicase AddA [Cognatishimia activa]UZD90732.1 double-strand break repair helicase AddA [Cognatishimia activa]
MKRNDATERQVQAARPDASTWLSANAGSGKTRVLTDRVARLLLEGVQPQHILCLTYTKAAASEMQNRLFKRLGSWAMRDDTALKTELLELGVEGVINSRRLNDARTLFARAIETPGGLKIQTIHSFCSSLLRRFPLEAGVSPLFKEMEDRAAALLREEIVDEMAGGNDSNLIADLARHFTGDSFEMLTADIVRSAHSYAKPVSKDRLFEVLGLKGGTTDETIAASVFLGDEADLIASLIEVLKTGGANDGKAAAKLAVLPQIGYDALPVLEGVFLTGEKAKEPFSAKIGSFPTKKLQKDHPDLIARLDKLMMRVEDARKDRLALANARRSLALWSFAHRFLEHYEANKQRLGWLDFDDLILRARNLLSDPNVAQWVLYRLDGGIDHILVDEAQDTSPVQWQVIERLAQEFTSGTGARDDTQRTIFVVGDKKQSIYSFQGADPAEFDRMRAEFGERLQASEAPLQNLELEYSFRSSDAVLRVVDACFAVQPSTKFEQHIAFNSDLPGRVDLWPVVEKTEAPEEGDWYDPVDRLSDTHHTVQLAQNIAWEIKRMIREQVSIPAKKGKEGVYTQRPVRAGDFLILVQRRSDLFQEIIRACKVAKLPIAGADRLKVGAEMAVKDLEALLKFLGTPEDSLSLATVLRSPLLGWSEQQLFDLAHRRTTPFLWQALRDRGEEFPKTMTFLGDLMGQTDFLRPYDLIERILTRHDGRRKLLARLGNEAEDGINALLSQALAYERSAVPSLTGFLVWMETDDLEIKRQMDSASDQIRVMTVHGSKGLEAPIVIMPDTGKRLLRMTDQIVHTEDVALWNSGGATAPDAVRAARETKADAQRQERMRLLYVAMTRAEKWLIVAAAGDLDKSGDTWYQTIEAGMKHLGAEPHGFAEGQGLRYEHGDWSGELVAEAIKTEAAIPELPLHYKTPAAKVSAPDAALSPSDLGGAKALPGEAGLDEEAAKKRGRQIHLLLEHLADEPEDNWHDLAPRILENAGEGADTWTDLLAEAALVLRAPELQHLFASDTLAEVSLTASLGDQKLHGTIDRLIISESEVLAVDFKTNAVVPSDIAKTPEGLLRQMGAYAHALKQIYPGKTVKTALLWTKTGQLMSLPDALITEALGNVYRA